ncbi:hypothetical protein, partial [Lysobacter sp. F6437]|uniref:hypothetical protein n=1 Tax=Lysobacter sp. F6437 TaxID=3459296 RepID=UPI00403E109F
RPIQSASSPLLFFGRGLSHLVWQFPRSNNSFKPNLLRYTNNMAGKACHVVGSATQVGLTQALDAYDTF